MFSNKKQKSCKAGEIITNEPKAIDVLLDEYFQSDEPLAVAFRNWKAKSEAIDAARTKGDDEQLFKDVFPSTELDVDLKLLTRQPGRIRLGAFIDGAITRDAENHFCFIQNATNKKKVVVSQRNPHVYRGSRVNVIRMDDGSQYPTFNRPSYTNDFGFSDFCKEAAEELLAIAGLIE